MSKAIIKTKRKPKIKFFEARYTNSDGEMDSFFFASDAMRKPLKQEAQEAYALMVGDKKAKVAIEDVYTISEIYDYTTKTNYRLTLRAK
jgi:hypothetical protein